MNKNPKLIIPLLMVICSIVTVLFHSQESVRDVYEYTQSIAHLPTPAYPQNPLAHKKVALLDLADFITEDTKHIIRKIGVGKMASYTLTHWRNPVDACLDMLEKMSADDRHKSALFFSYKERRMPHCIIAWQQGTCLSHEVRDTLLRYAEEAHKDGFFSSVKEKDMAKTIIEIVFNPAHISAISKPIPSMVKLAKELKKQGYALYGTGNLAQEVYNILAQTYPDIMSLFDGIVTSHQTQILKTNKKFLKQVCDTYRLNPAHCIVIDKEPSLLQLAQDMGMTSVSFTQHKNLRATLKKQGILP